jgi:hypothetical protein
MGSFRTPSCGCAVSAQAEAWDTGLQFYALLKRRAKRDGNIAQAVALLAQSFA